MYKFIKLFLILKLGITSGSKGIADGWLASAWFMQVSMGPSSIVLGLFILGS